MSMILHNFADLELSKDQNLWTLYISTLFSHIMRNTNYKIWMILGFFSDLGIRILQGLKIFNPYILTFFNLIL